ncbi:hypothetical protein [Halorhabdus rudnickae]|uniref:hypothetical protein n=1 Tax=Halorhabdus rudnickae TaxID=1775544 RepID=UPI0010834726|nr:hypothetical protein [Halorhabdus rudnickae]
MVLIEDVVVGVLLLVVGAILVVRGRSVADMSETIDAIGSTNSFDGTEAAAWRVTQFKMRGVVVCSSV